MRTIDGPVQDGQIILLADDAEDDVFLFLRACDKEGFEHLVRAVPDGQQAIWYLEGKPPYDDRERFPFPRLLLLDLKMPNVDGFDVMTWVRSSTKFSRLPIIILTGSHLLVDKERAFELGALGYHVKSTDPDRTLEFAHRICHKWLGHVAMAH